MSEWYSDPLDRMLDLASIPRPPAPAQPAALAPADAGKIARLLPFLRCPETGQGLRLAADGSLTTRDGSRSWPAVAGRPNLFPGLRPQIHLATHISNPLDQSALDLIRDADGMVLNLSAGGTVEKIPNVIEAEAAVFRHTDVIADAHRLPFSDGCFAAVVAYNAFEHYHNPRRVAEEIFRVLRPGGQVLVRTAFLQPLHEAPWHFYNCTKYGLELWFVGFETLALRVSDNFQPAHALAWLASECEKALRSDVSRAAAERFAGATVGEFIAMWRDPARRTGELWENFSRLGQAAQEVAAAGFEYLGRRPG
jgi:SAM-dependent methyltransferase